MAMTRILFATDFHGSDVVFRKFIFGASHYEADVLIVGGDVTGKAMVPILNQGNGRFRSTLFGRKEEISTQEELKKFKQVASNIGFYPIVLEPEEARLLEKDQAQLSQRFEREMVARVQDWLSLAEEKLSPKNIPLFFMPGNDDTFAIDAVIEEFERIHNPDGRCFWIDDHHELVGLSNANMTPWKCVRDVEETEMEHRLKEIGALLEFPSRAVVNLHAPPFQSGLDISPELDETLKIKTLGGQISMKPVGSAAVRKFIEKFRPLLSLHGHIHESPGYTRIGRTLAINPGSEYTAGTLNSAIINLERDRVKSYILVSA